MSPTNCRCALPVISLLLASLAGCGSSKQLPQSEVFSGEQMPQTENFNKALNAGAASGPVIFSLSVSTEKQHELIVLFCRLRNVSDQRVKVDDAYLPWNTLGMLTAIAFDARGKQLRTNMSIGGIFTEGSYSEIAAGQELTGSIDMETFLNANERPLTGDVVFHWVYLPRIENPGTRLRALSGTTVLPAQLR